jgi:O-acetyl-ADP-ribose deacetylase (regulator of RNase III)
VRTGGKLLALHLVDIQLELVEAWKEAFASFPEVNVHAGDILRIAENTIVSPANSYGFMDGGIDLQYREFFGVELEHRVREIVAARPEKRIPVGTAAVVRTQHSRIPFLILAPTMEMPEAVPATHAYRALRAVLRRFGADSVIGRRIYCPGLGTLTGRIPVIAAAREMASAYRDWRENRADRVLR